MSRALIIIDVQNEYLAKSNASGHSGFRLKNTASANGK
jgi:nicotinamidase-related amidase